MPPDVFRRHIFIIHYYLFTTYRDPAHLAVVPVVAVPVVELAAADFAEFDQIFEAGYIVTAVVVAVAENEAFFVVDCSAAEAVAENEAVGCFEVVAAVVI